MKKKFFAIGGISAVVLGLIFSCTMMEKCCTEDTKKETGSTSCNKNCGASPEVDSTEMNK